MKTNIDPSDSKEIAKLPFEIPVPFMILNSYLTAYCMAVVTPVNEDIYGVVLFGTAILLASLIVRRYLSAKGSLEPVINENNESDRGK
jgi:hypothetical protein